MALKNFNVINHPVRMRIFQVLHTEELSINQLSERLADVPKPSLYRHVNRMVEAGIIEVTRTRLVKGVIVDSTHLVAFDAEMPVTPQSVGGLKSTLFSGEGFVVQLSGPGRILMQTRSPRAFLDWLIPQLPKSNSSQS